VVAAAQRKSPTTTLSSSVVGSRAIGRLGRRHGMLYKIAVMTDDHDHEIKVKGGAFELSDLGLLLPGMAEIMPLVGVRIWKCYYAGRARNQELAAFQLKEAVSLMEKAAVLRPKYSDDLEKFTGGIVEVLREAIATRDWDTFESAFDTMVEEANAYHEQYDKGFLRWKVPSEPPPDLDFTPLD
jgi:hypothetical protein